MWGQFKDSRYKGKLCIASCIFLNPEVNMRLHLECFPTKLFNMIAL